MQTSVNDTYLVFSPVASDALQLLPPHLPEVRALGERLEISEHVFGRRHPLDAVSPAAERGGLFPYGTEPREPAPRMGGPRGPAFFVASGTVPIVDGDVAALRGDSLRQRRFRAAHCLRISPVVRHSLQLEAHNNTGSTANGDCTPPLCTFTNYCYIILIGKIFRSRFIHI